MGKMDARKAYASLNMPPGKYLMRFAVPLTLTGAAVVLILRIAAPVVLQGTFGLLIYAIPIYFLILAAIYPYIVAEGKKQQIDNNIHFYVTHMATLATSNIPRAQIMRLLAEKSEYGALAEETRKIFMLVDSWNMSLAEACRFIAKRTPSEIFSDFLDRFAYSLESGEDLEQFLRNEQVVIMEDFSGVYKGALYEVENMKNLFNSMMMSLIFIVIFAILMPIITGMDATMLVAGALALVAFIEVMFVYFTKAKAPTDPIWHKLKVKTRVQALTARSLPFSIGGCVAVLFLVLSLTDWPPAITIALSLTPLLYTGLIVAQEEERVKRRDDSYPAFIRSLGASASARGGQVTEALRHLQNHDFGPLTKNIKDLYRRLTIRVDDHQAWHHFAADCGSNLIEKFNRMFLEAIKAGGKPDGIGRIISTNFVSILTLRKQRYQTAGNFRGLLYGLIAGMAFSLFVGVGIVGKLQDIFKGIDLPADTPFSSFLHFQANLPLMSYLIVLMLLVHSIASGLMLKIADGGNYFRTYVDTVGMFWVAAIVSVAGQKALTSLL